MLPLIFNRPTGIDSGIRDCLSSLWGKEVDHTEEFQNFDPNKSFSRTLLFRFTDGTFERISIDDGDVGFSPTIDKYIDALREKIQECLTNRLPPKPSDEGLDSDSQPRLYNRKFKLEP